MPGRDKAPKEGVRTEKSSLSESHANCSRFYKRACWQVLEITDLAATVTSTLCFGLDSTKQEIRQA